MHALRSVARVHLVHGASNASNASNTGVYTACRNIFGRPRAGRPASPSAIKATDSHRSRKSCPRSERELPRDLATRFRRFAFALYLLSVHLTRHLRNANSALCNGDAHQSQRIAFNNIAIKKNNKKTDVSLTCFGAKYFFSFLLF